MIKVIIDHQRRQYHTAALWQYDKRQILELDGIAEPGWIVDFAIDGGAALPGIELDENRRVWIPDTLLETGEDLIAYVRPIVNSTRKEIRIPVNKRPMRG